MGFRKDFCTTELSGCCHSEPVSESVGGSRRWFSRQILKQVQDDSPG